MAVRWGSNGGYFRSRVVKIDEEAQKLRVNFVDFGNTLSITLGGENEDDVMRLPPNLLHRRFRAVECHLADIVPVGVCGLSSSNSSASSNKFVRLFIQSFIQIFAK